MLRAAVLTLAIPLAAFGQITESFPFMGEEKGPHEIVGVVRDAETGEPVARVVVHAFPAFGGTLHESEPTDAEGRFRIGDLPESTYEVGPSNAEGYPEQGYESGKRVTVNDETGPGYVELTIQKGHTISGYVRDADGTGVGSAIVYLLEHDGNLHDASTTSGEDGHFVFDAVYPEIECRFVAVHGEFVSQLTPLLTVQDKLADIALRLGRPASVAGRVETLSGEPVADATVVAQPMVDDTFLGMTARSDSQGRFEFKGLFGETYGLTIADEEEAADFLLEQTDFTMDSLREMIMQSLGAEGADLTDEDIEQILAQAEAMFSGAPTDINVHPFRVEMLSPSLYAPGVSVEVAAGAAVRDVVLQKGAGVGNSGDHRIEGVVVDAAGAPVSAASIDFFALSLDESEQLSLRTDAEGRFVFEGLADGQYMMMVVADGFADETGRFVTPADSPLELTLQRVATVHGRVVEAATGQPITSFRIGVSNGLPTGTGVWSVQEPVDPDQEEFWGIAFDDEPPYEFRSFSDPDGLFTLDNVDPGAITLFARAEGFALGAHPLENVPDGGEVSEVIIALSPSANIRGTIIDTSGAPIAGAKLYFSRDFSVPEGFGFSDEELEEWGPAFLELGESHDDGAMGVSGDDGVVVLDTAPSEGLWVHHADYAPAYIAIGGRAREFSAQLTEGGSVRVRATRDGAPFAGIGISIHTHPPFGQPTYSLWVEADDEGVALIERLPTGRYQVSGVEIDDPGIGLEGDVVVDVQEGKVSDARIDLTPASVFPAFSP